MVKEIRCSQLHRPMNCIGYLSLENLLAQEEGEPAREGTAIGELLSEMIRQKTNKPRIGATATNGFFLSDEMWFYARQTYQDILERSGGAEISTEERIDWMTESGILIRGQYDICYFKNHTLYIEDLKYGWGLVEVKENWQLLGYAIGKLLQLNRVGIDPQRINFTIHQPRPYHEDGQIREWSISVYELLDYMTRINKRLLDFVGGDKTLTTGKSCKYCEGVTVCPAFNRLFYNSIDVALTEWREDVMNNDMISKKLDVLQRASEALKIKQDSLKSLAIMRLQANQIVPGYSYEMKYGDRKWKDGVTAEAIKIMTGVDVTKVDMMSPNQAEKAGVNKKITSQLVTKAVKGVDLVKKDITEEAKKIFKKPEGI